MEPQEIKHAESVWRIHSIPSLTELTPDQSAFVVFLFPQSVIKYQYYQPPLLLSCQCEVVSSTSLHTGWQQQHSVITAPWPALVYPLSHKRDFLSLAPCVSLGVRMGQWGWTTDLWKVSFAPPPPTPIFIDSPKPACCHVAGCCRVGQRSAQKEAWKSWSDHICDF